MYQLIQNKLGGLKLGEHNMIGQNSKEEKVKESKCTIFRAPRKRRKKHTFVVNNAHES
jgi:hypothetical protein